MKRKSIAGKVSFGVSLLFIILLAILSYINYSDSKANTTELLVNEREKVTQSAESLLKTQFGDDINTVESLAKLLGSSNYSNEEVEKTLKVIENSSSFDLMFVGYQNDGMMIRSNGNSHLPTDKYDPRKRSWYQEVIKKNKTIISEPYISATGQRLSITIAAPIYSNNTLIGVVGADTAIDKLSKEFVELGNAEGAYILLMDKNAKVIMHPTSEYIGKALNATKEILKNYQNKNFDKYGRVSYTHENGSQKLGKCINSSIKDWIICSNIDVAFFEEKTDAIFYKQILLSIIFVLFASFAVLLLAKKFLKPMDEIVDGLKNFFDFLNHKNNNPKDIKLNSNDEFGVMAKMINENINLV
ncbi:PDC sensor domain-containing protein, partial [Campylobacter hyointestinalis]